VTDHFGIRYATDVGGVTADQLAGFWEGWAVEPSAARHLDALRGSEIAIIAIDEATDRVVGFVTAIGDGALAAFIPLLEVLPQYRGQGIGSELVRRVLDALHERYSIDLVCDDDLVHFYERLGFDPLQGMSIRNRAALG
jgi:predicted N-acetyltransferase YhbS